MASYIDLFHPSTRYGKFQTARGILHGLGYATPYPKYRYGYDDGFRTIGYASKYRYSDGAFRTVGGPNPADWDKNLEAKGVLHSLGGFHVGSSDWQAFLQFNTEMAAIFAPVLGQYLGTKAIQKADSDTKIQAIQTYLTGRTLQAAGRSSGASSVTMTQLLNFVRTLPADQREQYIRAACADLVSKTTDPSARSAIQAQCNALLKDSMTTWEKIKWPVIIGSVALGAATIVFVARRKEFIWGREGIGVRA